MERRSICTPTRRASRLAGLLALAALSAALAACGGAGGAKPGAEHAGTAPDAGRRAVAVYPEAVPAPSEPGEPLSVFVIAGTLPATPAEGIVQTDEDCAPDEYGVSRCRNEILLANGNSITVRHVHDMSVVPCLAPGEEVDVRPAA